jgi:hypothetical protein
MPETTNPDLSDVAGTSLITLYLRAVESQRPDALMKDERAEAVVRQLDQESLRRTLPLTEDSGRVVMILKTREFDRFTQDFLARRSRIPPLWRERWASRRWSAVAMPPCCSKWVIASAWMADEELLKS